MKQCAVELAKITAAAEIPKVTKKGAFRGWACYIERGLECRREVPTGHLNNFSSRANKYNKKKRKMMMKMIINMIIMMMMMGRQAETLSACQTLESAAFKSTRDKNIIQ